MSFSAGPDLSQMGVEEVKRNWGWFVALGIALEVLGLIALSAAAFVTAVAVEIFGWLLVVSGLLSALHGVWRRRWSGFFLELFAGILYLVAGILIATHPLRFAAALTFLMALFFMVGGLFRIGVSLTTRFHN